MIKAYGMSVEEQDQVSQIGASCHPSLPRQSSSQRVGQVQAGFHVEVEDAVGVDVGPGGRGVTEP